MVTFINSDLVSIEKFLPIHVTVDGEGLQRRMDLSSARRTDGQL